MKTMIFLLLYAMSMMGLQNVESVPQNVLVGSAIKIVDGDTFDLLVGTTIYRIRLNGIDTPERGQPFYKNAKDALGNWCRLQPLTVKYKSKDRNGRLIGDVYTTTGYWINLKLVEEGLAWHYKKYSTDKTLATAEKKARANKTGLWKEVNPVAPWIWRRK
jgi:endonuclease YncB( thermonuclease family)